MYYKVKVITIKTAKDFLTENRVEVINYYNEEVKDYWTISLKDFMIDLMSNFRKCTKKEIKEFTRTDLNVNLADAKSRLGCFNKAQIDVRYTKPYSKSNQAKRVRYYGKEKAEQLRLS